MVCPVYLLMSLSKVQTKYKQLPRCGSIELKSQFACKVSFVWSCLVFMFDFCFTNIVFQEL